jgi:N-acetylneuraminate synthase
MEKPLHWTASVWDMDSLNFLLKYEVPFIKIPSAMLTQLELIGEAASSGKPLVVFDRHVRTQGDRQGGQSDHDQSEQTNHHAHQFELSDSPSRTQSGVGPVSQAPVRLRYRIFRPRIRPRPTVIAVSLAAKVIERHITLSHDMWGTDQKSSLEVLGMDMLRKRCQEIGGILGTPEKHITPSEVEIRRGGMNQVPRIATRFENAYGTQYGQGYFWTTPQPKYDKEIQH